MNFPITLTCPNCDAKLKIRDEAVLGRKVKCPRCSTSFRAEAPSDEEDDSQDWEDESDPPPPPKRRRRQTADESDDDFVERKPKRSRKSKKKSSASRESGDSTLKVLLLVFGSLACVTVLVCCGGGVWVYFEAQKVAKQVQEAFKDVALTNPEDIRRVTGEITDITIPSEFIPKNGTSVLGTKFVFYNWCPTGTCDPANDNLGGLSLMTSTLAAAVPNQQVPDPYDKQFTDEELKKSLKDFHVSKLECDIRQKRCIFYIVKGEVLPLPTSLTQPPAGQEGKPDSQPEMENDEDEDEDSSVSDLDFFHEEWIGKRIVRIAGRFPGKDAECMLQLNLKEDQYKEEVITALLKSIR